jgi:trimeric autotransporter adhesin
VSWSSSATGIATVSSGGVVTAVAPGSATITATSGGKSGTAAITVSAVPVGSVKVNPGTISLTAGQGTTLTATVLDVNGAPVPGASITWSTSNAQIANVTSGGAVTTATAGTATITAMSGGASGTATVTVVPGPAAKVTVTPGSASIKNKATVALTAVATDAYGNMIAGSAFKWSSADKMYADVDPQGVVTGKKATVVIVIPFSVTITAELKQPPGASPITGTSSITVTP